MPVGGELGRLGWLLGERGLVLVLELLDGRERDDLGWVKAAAVPDLLADPVRGVVEDRRSRDGRLVGVAPGVGLLPHVGDLLRAGGLPPGGLEHGAQALGREQPLGVDPGLRGGGGLLALVSGLFDRVLARGDRASCGDRRGGERELQLALDLLGDTV